MSFIPGSENDILIGKEMGRMTLEMLMNEFQYQLAQADIVINQVKLVKGEMSDCMDNLINSLNGQGELPTSVFETFEGLVP